MEMTSVCRCLVVSLLWSDLCQTHFPWPSLLCPQIWSPWTALHWLVAKLCVPMLQWKQIRLNLCICQRNLWLQLLLGPSDCPDNLTDSLLQVVHWSVNQSAFQTSSCCSLLWHNLWCLSELWWPFRPVHNSSKSPRRLPWCCSPRPRDNLIQPDNWIRTRQTGTQSHTESTLRHTGHCTAAPHHRSDQLCRTGHLCCTGPLMYRMNWQGGDHLLAAKTAPRVDHSSVKNNCHLSTYFSAPYSTRFLVFLGKKLEHFHFAACICFSVAMWQPRWKWKMQEHPDWTTGWKIYQPKKK